MRKHHIKFISALILFSFLLTQPVYPQDFSSLRAQSFLESKLGRKARQGLPLLKPLPPAQVRDANPELAQRLERAGLTLAKHGEGLEVATAELACKADGGLLISDIKIKEKAAQKGLKNNIENSAARVKDGIVFLEENAEGLPVVKEALAEFKNRKMSIPVEFLDDHDRVMDIAPLSAWMRADTERVIRFDTDMPVVMSDGKHKRGLAVLYALGVNHEMWHCLYAPLRAEGRGGLAGIDNPEYFALDKTITFFETLAEEDRDALVELLQQPQIDNGKVFLRFLLEGAGKERMEKDRQIALIQARALYDVPYDNEAVRRAITENMGDLAKMRAAVNAAISSTYVREIDDANVARLENWCVENDKRLVAARYSRGVFTDALLIAVAKSVARRDVMESIAALEAQLRDSGIDFQSGELKAAFGNFQSLYGQLNALLNITADELMPQEQLRGRLNGLKEALLTLETKILEAVDRLKTKNAYEIGHQKRARGLSPLEQAIDRDRETARSRIDEVRRAISEAEFAFVAAPKVEPAYVVLISRIHEVDSLNIARVNELEDPSFGSDERQQHLLVDAGHNICITPDTDAVLEAADDWIEQLPAYANYVIEPLPDGGYKITSYCQRGALREVFTAFAEKRAVHIERVRDSEHAALARELLIGMWPALSAEADKMVDGQGVSREEAIRRIAASADLGEAAACLSAIVERTYSNLFDRVTQIRRDSGNRLSRLAALAVAINEDKSAGNLVADFLSEFPQKMAKGQSHEKAARELAAKKGLAKAGEKFRPIALQKRRRMPSDHVGTTLGPTETEINIDQYVQEAVTLFNIMRHFGLEDTEVAGRVEGWRERIAAAGEKAIKEMELEGRLAGVMQDEGMDENNPDHRARAVGKLLVLYPQLAQETARLCVLLDYERPLNKQGVNPKDAGEPACVTAYIKQHPELEIQAMESVVVGNGLEGKVTAFMQAHHASRQNALRAILNIDGMSDNEIWQLVRDNAVADIVEERRRSGHLKSIEAARRVLRELFKNEKKSFMNSRARRAKISELGMDKKVNIGSYVQEHTGPLARFNARREIIAEHKLSGQVYNPNFRYEYVGPYKEANQSYDPSRVDLGPEIIASLMAVPKLVGGRDADSARSAAELYNLYNTAGVRAVASTRIQETAKTGENFFSRGGVYVLSNIAGTTVEATGAGDIEYYRKTWAARGDRIPLPAGETYSGFCVPKEFCLIMATVSRALDPNTTDTLMDEFGVPKDADLRSAIKKDLEKAVMMQTDYDDPFEWEKAAIDYLKDRYPQYFTISKTDVIYIPNLSRLAIALQKLGILSADEVSGRWKRVHLERADWQNKKALGLEEVNRTGPFDKVLLIWELAEQAWAGNERIRSAYKDKEEFLASLRIVMGAGYKEDVDDVRFGPARKLEVYAGTAFGHLLEDVDPEGRALYKRLFRDYVPPADVRVVGTCTANDLFGHMPINFAPYAQRARKKLLEAGAAQDWIERNSEEYGLAIDDWEWAAVPGLNAEQKSKLMEDIRDDIIFVVYGNNLTEVSEGVKAQLIAKAGFREEQIAANCGTYGGRLAEWAGIKEMPPDEKGKLIKSIGPAIYLLVAEMRSSPMDPKTRGIYSKARYLEALTSCDVVDLGTPDSELLDLIDDLPQLLYRLAYERPQSAMLFADGTQGARLPAFAMRYPSRKRKVKELYALAPQAVYGSMRMDREGTLIDPSTTEQWRREMETERDGGQALFEALTTGRYEEAQRIYNGMVSDVVRFNKHQEAAADETEAENMKAKVAQGKGAKWLKSWLRAYHFRGDSLSRVARGLPLSELDFGTWLVLGGQYTLNGKKSKEETERERARFEDAIAGLRAKQHLAEFTFRAYAPMEISDVVAEFVRPAYVPPKEGFREIPTGIASSLKAVEETGRRIERRSQLRKEAAKRRGIAQRKAAFKSEAKLLKVGEMPPVQTCYGTAIKRLGDPRGIVTQEAFGRFLVWARAAYINLVESLVEEADPLKTVLLDEANRVFQGGELLDSEYDALGRRLGQLAESAHGNKQKLEDVARMAALLDTALLMEKTIAVDEPKAVWSGTAKFFDKTLNNHIFDYIPYHFHEEKGVGFEGLGRSEKFELTERNYRWLYTYARNLLVARTEMVELEEAYQDAWLGDADRDIMGIGINVTAPAERFCFSYARLRDASVLRQEGYPLPEIFGRITARKRTNVAVIYPTGNTTVPIVLRQCHRLAQAGINVFVCPFPNIEKDGAGNEILTAADGFWFMPIRDYVRALDECGLPPKEVGARMAAKREANRNRYKAELKKLKVAPEEIEKRVSDMPDTGVLVAATFKEPVRGQGIWFHTFHPMRLDVDRVEAALIQPFLWEAATHLKSTYEKMYRGSGVLVAPRLNWYGMNTTPGKADANRAEHEVRAQKEDELKELLKANGARSVIIKPEVESGGRGSRIFEIFSEEGELIPANLAAWSEYGYEMSKRTTTVNEIVFPSSVRQLYTDELVAELRDRFIMEVGAPITPTTPLFSYFRYIISQRPQTSKPDYIAYNPYGVENDPEGVQLCRVPLPFEAQEQARPDAAENSDLDRPRYDITFLMTVLSTAGVANVGLGGRLFEYRSEKINPAFRDDLWYEFKRAASACMKAQRHYIRENWQAILTYYLEHRPDFKKALQEKYGGDMSHLEIPEIPYEMGDLKEVVLIDKDGNLKMVYDIDNERLAPLFDEKGHPMDVTLYYEDGTAVQRDTNGNIPLFDNAGNRIKMYFTRVAKDAPQALKDRYLVRSLTVAKLEPNPLAGLWSPHDDRLKIQGREGEGVFRTFKNLGDMAAMYGEDSGEGPAAGPVGPTGPTRPGRGPASPFASGPTYLSSVPKAGGQTAKRPAESDLKIDPVNFSTAQARQLLGNAPNFALCFNAEAEYIQDAVLVLQRDACGADNQRSANVLGVHEDWMTEDGLATKALLVDEDMELKEATFETPVPISLAMTQHLRRQDEKGSAARIADKLDKAGIPQVNSLQAQQLADNKFQTICSLPKGATPKTVFIGQEESEGGIEQQAQSLILDIVISRNKRPVPDEVIAVKLIAKPNTGTEGEGVLPAEIEAKFAENGDLEIDTSNLGWDRLIAHIKDVKKKEDCIIQEERGNVFFFDGEPEDAKDSARRVCLGVNVVYDGKDYVAESGFAQVAKDNKSVIASVEQGGEIVDINLALAGLYYQKPDGSMAGFTPTREDIQSIKEAASTAARSLHMAFARYDIVLEVDENGRLIPIFLEANARPAGIQKYSFISDEPVISAEYDTMQNCGITRAMWSGVDKGAFGAAAPVAEYTIPQWLDIVRNYNRSGFADFLRNRYGDDVAKIHSKTKEYERVLVDALNTGIYDTDSPVVITATPGRVRVFGGHPDAPGIMVDAVSMATAEEIIMVIQRAEADKIILRNADPEQIGKEFGINEPGVKPHSKITSVLEWDAWARSEVDAGHVPTNRATDWDMFARAIIAFYQGKYFGERQFSGLRVYVAETDLPIGGFSSSSSIVMGLNHAIDELFGLNQTQAELIYNGYCERTFCGQAAGIADHAVIAQGQRGVIIDMRNSPEEPRETVRFPSSLSVLMVNSGISREMDMREISAKFADEFGRQFGDANVINRRTGASGALSALWVRHNFPQYDEGMTHYERARQVPPQAIIGYLRALLPQGECGVANEAELFEIIRAIPERISRDELRKSMPEFNPQLEKIFSNHPEPAGGYRLRETAIYGLSEGERVRLFVEACRHGDVDMIMELQHRGHDGDRVTRYNITIDDSGNTISAAEIGFNPGLSDADIDSIINGQAKQNLWQCAGTFERSLELIDYFCDLIDAWSKKTGIKAAARISAAGLGGNISVFCEKRGIAQLTDFIKRNYYDKLDNLSQLVNIKGSIAYAFNERDTVGSFSPGEGAQVVTVNLRTPIGVSVFEMATMARSMTGEAEPTKTPDAIFEAI